MSSQPNPAVYLHLYIVSICAKLTLESLLAELLVLKDSAEVREVHQGVVPSHHVGKIFPELWVKHLGHSKIKIAGSNDVTQRNRLPYKKGVL